MTQDDRPILPLDGCSLPLRIDADGVARIDGTRVTLDTVVRAFERHLSAEEIVARYSSLDLADVYTVIAYYLRHRPEVEAYLSERRERAAVVRAENEARFDLRDLRGRLLARRAARQPIEP